MSIGYRKLRPVSWTAAEAARLEKLFTGLASEWQKKSLQKLRADLREHLFAKQNRRCAYCRLPISENLGNAEIDHIIPKELAPQFSYCKFNLVLTCKRCNHRKHNHNPTNRSEWALHFLSTCPLESSSYRWVHPFIHKYDEHIKVSAAWVYRPVHGSIKAKAVIDVCKLAETKDVVARTRFSEALASHDDWRAILYLISRHDRHVSDQFIAEEFFRCMPKTKKKMPWVINEIVRVRHGEVKL